MLKNLRSFHHPSTIGEACSLLASKDRRTVILAGGTHLALIDDPSIEGLVDLKGLHLAFIRKSSTRFTVGAMTPVQDVYKSDVLTGPAGHLLKQASKGIGSTLLRNAITVGGNAVAVFPWSDLPPALLALDAEFVLRCGKQERVLPADAMYKRSPREEIAPGEILVEVRIPNLRKGSGTAFLKVAKTKNDYSMITVAARLHLEEKNVREARIVLNAVSRRVHRCLEAEAFLAGRHLTPGLWAEAANQCLEGFEFTADFRASKEYRREVLPVHIRRTLEKAAAMALV